MKDLSSIDFKDNVRYLVRRELKALGIKVPKNKGSKIQPQESCSESVFGNSLDQVPSVNVGEEFYCSIPKFLLDATEYLENHLGTEGLFRKSGSIQRQKNLKQKIENGESISDVQAHDVASLLKQFFRQLPEPLLTNQLNECFAKCQRLDCENSCAQAILYLCLLLPLPHLHTLQYFMRFAAKVASHAKESKMGTSNLAIVLTPNLINNPKKENSSSSEKILKDQTSVIDTLLKNSTQIGLVPDDVFERAKMIGGDDIDGLTSSGDELEDNQLRRSNSRMSRPRARTKSITGFVSGLGQRWKNSSAKTPGVARSSHRRSRSVKAEIMSNKDRSHPEYEHVTQKTRPKDDAELERFVALCNERRSFRQQNKRKPSDHSTVALSPASKRRALLRELELNGISHPTHIVSSSTQMFTTPTRRLAPIQPLSDVVKKEHAAKLLSSGETQHVKVVDAMNYVPSPDITQDDNTCANTRNVSTPCDNVPKSPVANAGDPARPQRRKATNAKNIRPSPYDNVLESPVSALGDPVRPQRRKVTRRHSSGATRCFSSSPRHRPSTQQDAPVIKEGARPLATSKAIPDDNDHKENTFNIMECSHMSVIAELVQLSKSPSRVIYTGSAEKKYSGRRAVPTNMTPCKYHNGTPPAPVPSLVMTELRNGLIDTEL